MASELHHNIRRDTIGKSEADEGLAGVATYLTNPYLCHIIRQIRYETNSFDLFGSTAGIGYAAVQMGPLQIGVAVVLNSYGDIFYRGKKIAGMQSDEADSYTTLLQTAEENLFISTPSGTTNTTLVALFTNGDFTPAQLKHLSQMASAGLARSISPAFTTADGDTVYAISVGPDEEKVPANLNAVGALSASLVEEAIADAVYSAGPLLLR